MSKSQLHLQFLPTDGYGRRSFICKDELKTDTDKGTDACIAAGIGKMDDDCKTVLITDTDLGPVPIALGCMKTCGFCTTNPTRHKQGKNPANRIHIDFAASRPLLQQSAHPDFAKQWA